MEKEKKTKTKIKTLPERLCLVREELRGIELSKSSSVNFDFFAWKDIAKEIKILLDKYKIFYYPSLVDCNFSIETNSKGKQIYICTLKLNNVFQCPETGEIIEILSFGVGRDFNDLVDAKAYTFAIKNLFTKLFFVNDGINEMPIEIEKTKAKTNENNNIKHKIKNLIKEDDKITLEKICAIYGYENLDEFSDDELDDCYQRLLKRRQVKEQL